MLYRQKNLLWGGAKGLRDLTNLQICGRIAAKGNCYVVIAMSWDCVSCHLQSNFWMVLSVLWRVQRFVLVWLKGLWSDKRALGLQIAILRIQLRTFDTLLTLDTLIMATLCSLDSCAHSSLLLKPLSWAQCMAKNGEGTLTAQPFTLLSRW